MAQTIVRYEVLLSCPNDVYQTCYPIVKKVIDNFNQMYGLTLGIEIRPKHWSTDSYPQSGGKPQSLLNEQIVDNSDASIAIFWKKFGTPTDKYGSGTEEEIERLLAEKKQVFLYFLDKPVPISELTSDNLQEYERVKEFRSRYKDKGIYCVVSDENELQKMLTLHLPKYFLEKADYSLGSFSQPKLLQSMLSVVPADDSDSICCYFVQLLPDSTLSQNRDSIISNIKEIIKNPLPPRSLDADQKLDYERQKKNSPSMYMINGSFVDKLGASISADDQKLIEEFCIHEKIDITPQFWNLGNLNQKRVRPISPFGECDDGLIGTSSETERFRILSKTASAIRKLNNDIIFCTQVENIPFIELAIKNDGTTFDEDVIVKLKFSTGSLLLPHHFPFPKSNSYFSEESTIHSIICPQITSDVMEYPDYPNQVHIPEIGPLPFESSEERFQRRKTAYYEDIKRLYCYEIFRETGQDILVCRFKEVQQHTCVLFPTRIFFKEIPSDLTYTIIGKHTPNVIEKTLNIQG